MRYALIVCGLLLGGCAGSWTKPGASEGQLALDMAQCKDHAALAHPVVIAYTLANVPQAPPRQECQTVNNQTRCVTIPGTYIPPTPQPIDLNAHSRQNEVHACLEQLGYVYSRR